MGEFSNLLAKKAALARSQEAVLYATEFSQVLSLRGSDIPLDHESRHVVESESVIGERERSFIKGVLAKPKPGVNAVAGQVLSRHRMLSSESRHWANLVIERQLGRSTGTSKTFWEFVRSVVAARSPATEK